MRIFLGVIWFKYVFRVYTDMLRTTHDLTQKKKKIMVCKCIRMCV